MSKYTMRQLDQHDHAILSTLTALGDGWHDRDSIARKLGHNADSYGNHSLSSEDLLALAALVTAGRIEQGRTLSKGNRIVYRIAQNGGAQ